MLRGCQNTTRTTLCLLLSRAPDPLSQTKGQTLRRMEYFCSKCTTSPTWVSRPQMNIYLSPTPCSDIKMLYRANSCLQICIQQMEERILSCMELKRFHILLMCFFGPCAQMLLRSTACEHHTCLKIQALT